jgi:hypothetical protein
MSIITRKAGREGDPTKFKRPCIDRDSEPNPEVLDDQVINLLCTQERFGYSVQLVSDVNRTMRTLQLGKRLGQATVAAGHVVDPGNIWLHQQHFSGGIIGGFVGVLAFNNLQDFDAFKVLAHNRTKPDFAIFMAAVGKATNHDGDFGA